MKEEEKINTIEKQVTYNDEIDLFELFAKIWKWKWMTIAIAAILTMTTFFYVKTRLDTYSTKAVLMNGKVANTPIVSETNLFALFELDMLCKKLYEKYNKIVKFPEKIKSNEMTIDFHDKKTGYFDYTKGDFSIKLLINSGIIIIIVVSGKPDDSLSIVNFFIEELMKRHDLNFKDGLKTLKKNLQFFKIKNSVENNAYFSPGYLLKSYTYPTKLLVKPIRPFKPDSKRVMIKVVIAFSTSIFLGIFLSFFIEYVVSETRKRRIS